MHLIFIHSEKMYCVRIEDCDADENASSSMSLSPYTLRSTALTLYNEIGFSVITQINFNFAHTE